MPPPPRAGQRATKKAVGAKKKAATKAGYPSKDDSDDEAMEAAKANAEADKAKAAEHKAKGNECFQRGECGAAVEHFTAAIACDPTDHVFFSNRSAAHLSLGNAKEALADAKECVRISPQWSKGYSRLGAALWKAGSLKEAKEAYDAGLKLEPTSAVLKQGREDLAKAMEASKEDSPAGAADTEPSTEAASASGTSAPPVLGIDLGTTYSCVAVWENGKVRVLEDDEGRFAVPSYVAFLPETGERIVGDRAKVQAAKNVKNTFFDVKRILGQKMYDEAVQKEKKRLPYTILEGSDKQPLLELELDGKTRTLAPEEISAAVLGEMKRIAHARLGRTDIKRAVVTVPAYFNDAQRKATMAAGAIAGLEVLRVINEPTAAALAYGLDVKVDDDASAGSNVLIFDLGGGTFDVSILRIEGGIFEVKATGGDTRLGGEDFDAAAVQFLVDELKKRHKVDIAGDSKAVARVRQAAEKAKRALSGNVTAKVEIAVAGEDYVLELSRSKFEALNKPFFTRTLDTVKRVLKDAKLQPADINDVVLVGGSTRIPMVQDLLKDFFQGKDLCRNINPDEAVAYGAAVQAAILSGVRDQKCTDLLLMDVTALSLGIELDGGQMSVLIPRNTSIPCSKSSIFTTADKEGDFAESLDIRVFEGERPTVDDNHLLGEFVISGIERAKRGEPQINVTFTLDANGTLNVTAEDLKTKAKNMCQITGACKGLGQEEIDRMIAEAERCAKEDEEMRRKYELKNELEGAAFSLSESDRDELLDWLAAKNLTDRSVAEMEAQLSKARK